MPASGLSAEGSETGDISPVIDSPDGALLVEMVKRMPAVMDKFAEKANKAAKQLSTTTTAYTDAALIFYQ